MELLVVWIVFSVVCALIASNKGQDVGMAAVGGCLFGPLALIYYLAAGDKKEKAKHDTIAQQQLNLQQQQIAMLQASLQAQGISLPEPPPAPLPKSEAVPVTVVEAEPEPQDWECPKCGQHNAGRAKACVSCLFEQSQITL